MARFTKLPFQVSTSHAKEAFELVHADIWGPYRVHTRGKYKFFLTLVDDYSRMVWVYLLQYKSDFIASFKAFHAYAITHFKMHIKVLKTDNALEFKDTTCNAFYAENRVIHQTTCPYKP